MHRQDPHQHRPTRTETSWSEMWRRVEDPTHQKYPRYGGRGISICPRWAFYANFLADMGERPENKTLHRIDNDGNYEPANCKWADHQEQSENKGTYKNNKSGLKGVSFDRTHQKWAAYSSGGNGKKVRLYFSFDFFEACCARKSWEAKNV